MLLKPYDRIRMLDVVAKHVGPLKVRERGENTQPSPDRQEPKGYPAGQCWYVRGEKSDVRNDLMPVDRCGRSMRRRGNKRQVRTVLKDPRTVGKGPKRSQPDKIQAVRNECQTNLRSAKRSENQRTNEQTREYKHCCRPMRHRLSATHTRTTSTLRAREFVEISCLSGHGAHCTQTCTGCSISPSGLLPHGAALCHGTRLNGPQWDRSGCLNSDRQRCRGAEQHMPRLQSSTPVACAHVCVTPSSRLKTASRA